MNIAPITINQNYQQQNFGALKIKDRQGALSIPWGLLIQHNLQNSPRSGMDSSMQLFTIIPTIKGSRVEREILISAGQNAESISISEARELIDNYRRFKDETGKQAKAPF